MLEDIQDRIKELKPFYVRSAVKNIFSWKDLENLLNLRPFILKNRFVFFTDERYEWPNQHWLSELNSFPPSVIDKIIKKYPCHITDASRVNEQINSICSQLDNISGLPTDAHIYFDLRDDFGKAFGIHYDYAHNLIAQIEGSSRVKIWNIKGEEKNVNHLNVEPIIDIIMEPGDLIYAPAYYYHEIESLTKRLSISFPMWAAGGVTQEREWIRIP